jgi:hypothetical protein
MRSLYACSDVYAAFLKFGRRYPVHAFDQYLDDENERRQARMRDTHPNAIESRGDIPRLIDDVLDDLERERPSAADVDDAADELQAMERCTRFDDQERDAQ